MEAAQAENALIDGTTARAGRETIYLTAANTVQAKKVVLEHNYE